MRPVLLAVLLAAALAACGTDSVSPVFTDSVDGRLGDQAGPGDMRSSGEAGLPFDFGADFPWQGPGTLGWPCVSDDECDSGVCAEHLQGFSCAGPCDEGCPAGWSCTTPDTGDPLCLPDDGLLCRPCTEDNECRLGADPDAVCLDYQGSGLFCATPCEVDDDCPGGYDCRVAELADGSSRTLCVRDDGSCGCAKKYFGSVLVTSCYATNEHGLCTGERTCAEGVLSACDAPVPQAESCDGADNNCDGIIDPVGAVGCQTWYLDEDGDGHGIATGSACLCAPEAPFLAPQTGDCDDGDESVHPAALETCDGKDNNCNGLVDEEALTTWYKDNDGDGFGNPGQQIAACEMPDGYVADGIDCNDFNEGVHPAALESCNDLDDNCNGLVDEELELHILYPDNDDDGLGTDKGVTWEKCLYPDDKLPIGWQLSTGDCNDGDPTIYPGAPPLCDGKDNNCDGTVDRFCFSPCGGQWPFKQQYVSGWAGHNPIDLDGDGYQEVLVRSTFGFAILDHEGSPLSDYSSPVPNYTGNVVGADIDDYDEFGPAIQTLEILTGNASRPHFYKLNEDKSITEYVNEGFEVYSRSRFLAADLDFDGRPEFITTSWCEPDGMAYIFQFDPASGSINLVQNETDPDGACAYLAGRVLTDVDDDGLPELVAGNGYEHPSLASTWGGNIHPFDIATDGSLDLVPSCPGNDCFPTEIPGLYGGEVDQLFRLGDELRARVIYYETNVQGEENAAAMPRLWRYSLDGQVLGDSPYLDDDESFLFAPTDINDDGLLDPRPETNGAALFDVDGDGTPDWVHVDETNLVVALWDEESQSFVDQPGTALSVNGMPLQIGAQWDLDSDGRLDVLATDYEGHVYCYELGPATWHPHTSLPRQTPDHYRTYQWDNYEPNNGLDVDGDGLPDHVRRIPSALTAKGDFYSYLTSAEDEDFFELNTKWVGEICLTSAKERVYHMAVYSLADKHNNETLAPTPDGLPDGLVWSDDSDEPTKCFTGYDVFPTRVGEYRFIVKVWSDGDHSPYWPYWLQAPK